MANSRFSYVRSFELGDALLPNTFLVVRLDGKGFHAFSKLHNFAKPNDDRALKLMNEAALRVVRGKETMGECVCAFGESDEYRWGDSTLSQVLSWTADRLLFSALS